MTRESNPNGSLWNVAGLCNEGRNVFGLMPHPERCCEAILGGTDGSYVFRSILGLKPVGSALTPTLSQRERGSTQHSGLRTQNTEPTREHN